MAENLSRREALEDKNIERWYDNLQRRSLQTAETYLRRLMMFCRDNNISPEELLEIDENDLRDMLLDYVTRLSRTHSGNYINTIIHAVKNFLEFNHKKVSIRVYLRRESNASKKEKTPTKDELRKLLFFAKDMRARALTSLVAFSGLRLFSIGYHDGSDGLRLGDLPDLNIDNLEFEKVPSAIIVRQELSKAKHQYITFAGRQTCEYILGYLRWRKSRGEELSENSPLIATRSRKFLYTNQISSILRESILIAGYEWRPYLLRHYFDTQLLLAEGSGYIPNDYRVFWMGHKGNIEHVYTTNKHRLPEQLMEDMREKFEKASRIFLETDIIKEEPKQKVVKPEEIDRYIESGWEFLSNLPDGRVVIKKE